MGTDFINETDEPVDAEQAVTYWRGRWASSASEMVAMLVTRDRVYDAVRDLLWKATQYGTTEDGDTYAYILPKGAVHRLVGAMQCSGQSASLRAVDSSPPPA
jgi:hypothetical protein